ncbi:MAG: hypothetical protein NT154_41135, partial [Verrucomicrobia bacterium]|nr:hypothetical protein [Verrucomicrobiota bacterium]
AADMMPGPAAAVDTGSNVLRGIRFNLSNVLPGLTGPGIIDPPGSNSPIIFNKSGPIYYNHVTNSVWFLDELHALRYPMWASYDSSTNPPIVYPNGTSITNIESQMMMQVTSTTLPPGKVGTAYTTQLTGTGGSGPPYTWSLAPNSPPLPSALTLTLDGTLSGIPSTPTIAYFYVQMSDPNGRSTYWQVTLTVLP